MGAGGATGGQGEPVYCPACRFVILGRWQDERGRRVFRPNLHAARSVECGDGWVAVRCRRCDRRVELAHETAAA
jgi:hypothetical protein